MSDDDKVNLGRKFITFEGITTYDGWIAFFLIVAYNILVLFDSDHIRFVILISPAVGLWSGTIAQRRNIPYLLLWVSIGAIFGYLRYGYSLRIGGQVLVGLNVYVSWSISQCTTACFKSLDPE